MANSSPWMGLLAPRTGYAAGYVNPADQEYLDQVGYLPTAAQGDLSPVERAAVERQAEVDAPAQGQNYMSQYLAGLGQSEPQLQATPIEMAPMAGQPGAGGEGMSKGYTDAYKKLMDYQLRSQQRGEGELGTLKERLEKLKNAPVANDTMGQALAAAADVWGGGKGQFTQFYGANRKTLTEAQKAEAVAKLEETIRKGRGDLTDSETALLKAQLGFESDRMRAGAKGGTKLQQLPAGQAAELGDLSTVDDQINTMSEEWVGRYGQRGDGFLSRLGDAAASKVSGTEDNVYDAKRRQWAQTIGVPLEGGKLTEQDYSRYLDNFIPGPMDTPERAQAKAENLRKYAATKRGQRVNAFSSAGYDVGAFQGAARSGLSPEKEAKYQQLLAKKNAGTLKQ